MSFVEMQNQKYNLYVAEKHNIYKTKEMQNKSVTLA